MTVQDKRDPFGGRSYAERLAEQEAEPEPPPRKPIDRRPRAMTYRIGDGLVTRINAAAQQYNVEKSGLVRVLLNYALDALEEEELTLPLQQKPHKLDM